MSLKDINLDKNGEVIIIDEDICTDSYSEDSIFWRLRNTIIKVFGRDTPFWHKFKGVRYKNKYDFEEVIKVTMISELSNYYHAENDFLYLGIEVIIIESVAYIFAFRRQPFAQDELLIDFSIKL